MRKDSIERRGSMGSLNSDLSITDGPLESKQKMQSVFYDKPKNTVAKKAVRNFNSPGTADVALDKQKSSP
jgi:hypothetical protein